MTFKVLNVKKPCNVCRRRKVKCDKGRPCSNCHRHRVPCVYDEPREDSVARQHLLQERLDRLERIVEDMAAKALPPLPLGPTRSGSSSAASPLSSIDDSDSSTADTGCQIFSSSSSYHVCSSSWVNLPQLRLNEQQSLAVFPRAHEEEHPTWSISTAQIRPKNLDHLHLPPGKEDILIRLFFDHVEPFIRISHQPYLWKLIYQFRQGTCIDREETQALIFSVQYLAAALLPSDLLHQKLGFPKFDLVSHLQRATEFALDQAQLMQSRNILLFSALLYYMTSQFYTGHSEAGMVLLGGASSIAKRMGLHRDPAHYGYSQWHIEVRRRLWGHLTTLEAHHCNSDEHTLPSMSDVQASLNIDDIDWELPGYSPGELGRQDREGFSEATAALVKREVCKVSYLISKARRTATGCSDLTEILDDTMESIRQKFTRYFSKADPLQCVISKWCSGMRKSLSVSILYTHTLSTPKLYCHSFEELQDRLYEDCLACLEEFSQGEATATPHHWQWIFRWPMSLHVIAGLLSCLIRLPEHKDTARAWEQIDAAFQRYNNEEISMANVPAWHSIERLCDKAIILHPNQNHEGRAYTNRLQKSQPTPAPEMHAAMDSFGRGACGLESHDGFGRQTLADIDAAKAMNGGASDANFDPMLFDASLADNFWSIDF